MRKPFAVALATLALFVACVPSKPPVTPKPVPVPSAPVVSIDFTVSCNGERVATVVDYFGRKQTTTPKGGSPVEGWTRFDGILASDHGLTHVAIAGVGLCAGVEADVQLDGKPHNPPNDFHFDLPMLEVFTPLVDGDRIVIDQSRVGFKTQSGQPWSYRGLTLFELPALLEAGEDITGQLKWAARQHFNVLRVFSQHRHEDGSSNNVRIETLDRLSDLAASYGLYLEVVIQAFPGDMRPLGAQIYDLARRKVNILVEDTNEPGLHGYDSAPLASLDKHGVTWASGDYDFALANDPTGRVFTDPSNGSTRPRLISTLPRRGLYVTVHLDRSPEWPRKSKDAMAWRDGWNDDGGEYIPPSKVPVVLDEDMGADETDQGGRRSTNVDDFEVHFAIARLFAAGITYHFQNGLDGRVPAPGSVQQKIADRITAVHDFIPTEAYPCGYEHLQSLEEQFGALRIYKGCGRYVVIVRPTKNLDKIDAVFQPVRRLGNVLEVR